MGIIGYAPPAESLVWIIERELYWCNQLGLDMVAKVDAVDPTPNAATVATQSILAKASTYSSSSATTTSPPWAR